MNITLIGMSGAGKSHVGKLIAEQLGVEFYDVDTVIERRYGKNLNTILQERGEEAFMKEEESVVLSIPSHGVRVISPGGSIIYSEQAMTHLTQISTILFLDMPCSVIEARVDTNTRGIVGLTGRTFAEVYDERRPLYLEWADKIVTPDMTLDEIIALIA